MATLYDESRQLDTLLREVRQENKKLLEAMQNASEAMLFDTQRVGKDNMMDDIRENGVEITMKNLISDIQQDAPVRIDSVMGPWRGDWNITEMTMLCRIAQDLFVSMIRYTQSSGLQWRVRCSNQGLVMELREDPLPKGVVSDPAALRTQWIEHRVAMMHGRMHLAGEAGNPLQITIEVPR